MDSLGARLIRSLLSAKETTKLSEYRINTSDLLGDASKAMAWVLEFVRKHGEWPSQKIVEENCGVELPSEADPLDYICDQVRKRSLGKSLESDLRKAAEKLEGRDPDEAIRLVSDAVISHRKKSIIKSDVISFRESGKKRIELYDSLAGLGGYHGVETPWGGLNGMIQGWVDGTLNVVTAMQNTGKTWFLGVCANHALSLGKKVGFITLEMSTQRIARRMDSIKYKVPFKHLRNGDMDDVTEDTWKREVLRDTTGEGDILFTDKQLIRSVGDATSFVMEYRPDILFIDGGYRFQAAGRSNWEQQVDVVRSLQLSAESTNIPWIVSTQHGDASETGKDKKSSTAMRAWGVRFAKEWVTDPDVVIGLFANEDLRICKELEICCLKMRDNAGEFRSEIKINWDTTAMNFSEIEGDAPEDLGEAVVSF